MMKLVLSKWTADRVEEGMDPQHAAERALAHLKKRLHGHGGIIVVDTEGRYGMAHNTPRMAWAVLTPGRDTSGIDLRTPA